VKKQNKNNNNNNITLSKGLTLEFFLLKKLRKKYLKMLVIFVDKGK